MCGFVFDGERSGGKLRRGQNFFFLAIPSSFSIHFISTVGINT
jgi:hypothetical protein